PDGDALTFGATGLPNGLTIDTDTGLISGTLTAIGAFNVTVTVTDDGVGTLSESVTFTWTVLDGAAPTAPTGLTASVSTVAVTLNWTANTEPDLAGYRVYRSVNGAAFA